MTRDKCGLLPPPPIEPVKWESPYMESPFAREVLFPPRKSPLGDTPDYPYTEGEL